MSDYKKRVCSIGDSLLEKLTEAGFLDTPLSITAEVAAMGAHPIVVCEVLTEDDEAVTNKRVYRSFMGTLVHVDVEHKLAYIQILNKAVLEYPQHWFDDATLEYYPATDISEVAYIAAIRKARPLYHIPKEMEQWEITPTAIIEAVESTDNESTELNFPEKVDSTEDVQK